MSHFVLLVSILHVSGHNETAFTPDGFRNWKKASVSLKTHETAVPHKYAMGAWAEFKLWKEEGSKIQNVINLMNSAYAKAVEENWRCMQTVVESLHFTMCQNIAQCDEQSTNRGNFFELLHLLNHFNNMVKKKLLDGPGNAKYVHTIYRMKSWI